MHNTQLFKSVLANDMKQYSKKNGIKTSNIALPCRCCFYAIKVKGLQNTD